MEPAATTATTVEEYLGLERGEVRLPSAIKEKTDTYITMALEIGSGEEVQDLGADTFIEMMNAAWGAEVPEPIEKMLRKWFTSPVSKVKATSLKEVATPAKEEGARGEPLTLSKNETLVGHTTVNRTCDPRRTYSYT